VCVSLSLSLSLSDSTLLQRGILKRKQFLATRTRTRTSLKLTKCGRLVVYSEDELDWLCQKKIHQLSHQNW
jgi:hypothetical protein